MKNEHQLKHFERDALTSEHLRFSAKLSKQTAATHDGKVEKKFKLNTSKGKCFRFRTYDNLILLLQSFAFPTYEVN